MLYSDVAGARCDGYAISVTSTGAAAAANVSPNPIRNLPQQRVSQPPKTDSAASTWRGEERGEAHSPGCLPRADEHAHRVRCGLQDRRDAHDRRPEDDRRAPAEAVRHVRRERVRGEAPDVLYIGEGEVQDLLCRFGTFKEGRYEPGWH